jgi:hypothetical protein
MTMALEAGEGSVSRPGRSLPPEKTRYPLYRRLGGPQGRPGQVRKISPPTGIQSPDHPARSQSLYRLSYPAQDLLWICNNLSEYCKLEGQNFICIQDGLGEPKEWYTAFETDKQTNYYMHITQHTNFSQLRSCGLLGCDTMWSGREYQHFKRTNTWFLHLQI